MRRIASGGLPPPVPATARLVRVRQVHGAGILTVDEAPATDVARRDARDERGTDTHGSGPTRAQDEDRWATPAEADGVVTDQAGWCLAVLTADCASVALGSPEGVYGAVHVGWRGLMAGVVPAAVGAMQRLGATAMVAALGPCIHPCCYDFSPGDLAPVVERYGRGAAVTRTGRSALDLPGVLAAALEELDVPLVVERDECTACGTDSFSYRARNDTARQALLVWRHEDADRTPHTASKAGVRPPAR